jgi:hypothetical protein
MRHLADLGPVSLVKVSHPLERKPSSGTRRTTGRDVCGFDHHCARSTEGIKEGLIWGPARKTQQPCCKIFLERGLEALASPAPFEERLTGPIQIERCLPGVEMGKNATVWFSGIHRGAFATVFPVVIHQSVLDPLQGEMKALQWRSGGCHVDSRRGLSIVPTPPGSLQGEFVEIALIAVLALSDLAQHPTGESGMEVGCHPDRGVAFKSDTSSRLAQDRRAERS